MAAAVAVIVLLPLFFTSTGCHMQDAHALLLKVTGAIEKLISFYKESYQNLNLDGLFGLKVIEGMAARQLRNTSFILYSLLLFMRQFFICICVAHNLSSVCDVCFNMYTVL